STCPGKARGILQIIGIGSTRNESENKFFLSADTRDFANISAEKAARGARFLRPRRSAFVRASGLNYGLSSEAVLKNAIFFYVFSAIFPDARGCGRHDCAS